MKTTLKHLFFASVTLLTSLNFADSNESVIVNSRPLSQKAQETMAKDRQAEAEQSLDDPLAVLIIPIKGYQYTALTAPSTQVTEAEYSPYTLHWIDCFAMSGGTMFRLEDGSEWSFDKNDASILRTWRPNDIIIITPRQPLPWGSSYTYVITNKELNSSIYANLDHGPIRYGKMTTWVSGLNRDALKVNLINGQGERTAWEIAPSDQELFKEWEHHDTLIIGYNNSYLWWLSSYDHILINVNSNHFVRAKFHSTSTFPSIR